MYKFIIYMHVHEWKLNNMYVYTMIYVMLCNICSCCINGSLHRNCFGQIFFEHVRNIFEIYNK
jgi:hypothetical protein